MQLYSRGPLERLILTPLFCPACHTVDHVELLAHTIAHYTLYCASTPVAAAALGLSRMYRALGGKSNEQDAAFYETAAGGEAS